MNKKIWWSLRLIVREITHYRKITWEGRSDFTAHYKGFREFLAFIWQ